MAYSRSYQALFPAPKSILQRARFAAVILVTALTLCLAGCDENAARFDDPSGEYSKLASFPNVWQLFMDGPDGEPTWSMQCRFSMGANLQVFSSSLICLSASGSTMTPMLGEIDGKNIDFITGLGTQSVQPFSGTISDDFQKMSGEFLVYPGYPMRRWEAKRVS